MQNVTDEIQTRKSTWFNRLGTIMLYLACIAVYVSVMVLVLIIHKMDVRLAQERQCTSNITWMLPPPPSPRLTNDPMKDLRIQCLAAIFVKTKPHELAMVEMELADNRGVCVVAETIYPRGNVPETSSLPAWAILRATKAINHVD